MQACGGVGEDDVRRLRTGLGMNAAAEDDVGRLRTGLGTNAAAEKERSDFVACFTNNRVVIKDEDHIRRAPLVSLKTVLAPLIATERSVAQLCRRVRPVLERQGVPTFKRRKVIHVLQSQADRVLEVGRGVV